MFASEEVDDVKNRHRDWFMQLAETAEPKLRTGEQLTWLNQLELEHDNLRAAMNWSIEQKHIEQALRIPSALAYFWEIHGHEEEGRNWFKQALEIDDAKKKFPFAWATAVDGHFSISVYTPNIEQYQPRMEEALNIFREHGDTFRVGRVLYHLAAIPYVADELETAKSTFQAGFDSYQTINDKWGMGECLHCIAHVAEQQGAVDEAQNLFDQSLELLKPVGDRWSLSHPFGDTGNLAINRGDLNSALAIYQESIHTFEELGNREWLSISLRQLARIHYLQGNYDQAYQIVEQSMVIAQSANDYANQGRSYFRFGLIRWAQREFILAHQNLVSTVEMMEKTDLKSETVRMRCIAGMTECYNGQPTQGREKMELAIEFLRKESPLDVPDLLPWLGHVLWLETDASRARKIYQEAITEARQLHYFFKIPECLEGLGKIAVTQNDLERAARLFGAAEAMREKMGTPIPPVMRGDYDAHVALLRENMGTAFELSWHEGQAMTLEQSIDYAVETING
jgi:tetratricopeptide (TPR) repeat protein